MPAPPRRPPQSALDEAQLAELLAAALAALCSQEAKHDPSTTSFREFNLHC